MLYWFCRIQFNNLLVIRAQIGGAGCQQCGTTVKRCKIAGVEWGTSLGGLAAERPYGWIGRDGVVPVTTCSFRKLIKRVKGIKPRYLLWRKLEERYQKLFQVLIAVSKFSCK